MNQQTNETNKIESKSSQNRNDTFLIRSESVALHLNNTESLQTMVSVLLRCSTSPSNNLNTSSLSNYTFKCYSCDLRLPQFVFPERRVSLSTHPDAKLQNTNVCCLNLMTEYGGKGLFQISRFYLFNADASSKCLPACPR